MASTSVTSVVVGGRPLRLMRRTSRVRLAPGAGDTLTINFAGTRISRRWHFRGIAESEEMSDLENRQRWKIVPVPDW